MLRSLKPILLSLALSLFLCVFAFYAARWLAPFTLAWLFSTVVEPIVAFLHARLHLSRRVASMIVVTFATLLLLCAATLGVLFLGSQCIRWLETLPNLAAELQARITDLLSAALPQRTQALTGFILESLRSLQGLLSTGLAALASALWSTAASLPMLLASASFCVLSFFLFLSDRARLFTALRHHLPAGFLRSVHALSREITGALGGYLRAELLLCLVSMGISFPAFLLMGVEGPLGLALLIGLLDLLPLVGSGLVLLPWAAFAFVSGGPSLAVPLLALFAALVLARQWLEPRLMSASMGLHPLLGMLGMYAGFRLCGVAGLWAGPMLLLLWSRVWRLFYREGTIREIIEDTVK